MCIERNLIRRLSLGQQHPLISIISLLISNPYSVFSEVSAIARSKVMEDENGTDHS